MQIRQKTLCICCSDNVLCCAQVRTMGYWGMTSFLFSFFKWFFQGDPSSSNCGFSQFPSLGLKALAQSWNFDFSLTYIGVGTHLPPFIPSF